MVNLRQLPTFTVARYYPDGFPLPIATKPKIVVGLPTGRPLKDGKIPSKIVELMEAFASLFQTHEVEITHISNERESHAVNLLIEKFRNDENAEWFIWYNYRAQITPEQLVLLMEAKKGVCGALGTTCSTPSEWLASFYPDWKAEGDLLAVPELEAVVKVYHRSVFDVIEKGNPDLRYLYDNSGHALTAFCQEKLETFADYQRLLSPAYYLDFLCRKERIGIFAHTKVIVKTKGRDDVLYPETEPYRPWEHTREPAPVCTEHLPEAVRDVRPIAVCLQYCDKDKDKALKLAEWMVEHNDLQPHMIYSPGDKYPKGPNDTALKLLRQDWSGYKGVLLIEPDCTPMTVDWLEQLSDDWDRCSAAGKLIMGSWHPINITHPKIGHLNGNLIFSPEISKRIEIPDVPYNKPWDTFLADVFQPYWARTGLIKNLNRHRTATLKQLTVPECGTKPPVLVHGVRDLSAWTLSNQNLEPCKTPS